MGLDSKTLEKMINKMANSFLPDGVSQIVVKVDKKRPSADEYYVSVDYLLPDYSKHFLSDSDIRRKWNDKLRMMIKDYLNEKVIISRTGFIAKSFYDRDN